MEEKENVVKFTISMEKELRDWVDGKVKEMNRKDRRFKTSRSALIADAVQILKDSEEQGKAESQKSAQKNPDKTSKDAPIIQPEDHSDGGPSTRITGRSRQTG